MPVRARRALSHEGHGGHDGLSAAMVIGFTERVFAILSRNARPVTHDYARSMDHVIQFGTQIDL